MATDTYHLVGFYDPDPEVRSQVAQAFGIPAFPDAASLIAAAEVIDIVTPTVTHFELAKMAMEQGRHIFIEKPLAHTVGEAEELLALSHKRGVKVQVGHVERFNPALLAVEHATLAPMFIEAHRLATFNPRGTDVSVVLDLMIHDLDLILSMVASPVRQVNASGVAVVSDTPDIANARIEFENGCVANLTASRISLKQMRKVRLFQKDSYISLDFLAKEAQVVRLYDEAALSPEQAEQYMRLDTPKGSKYIHLDSPPIEPVNAIKMELESLAHSIQQGTRPKVSIEDGYEALRLAHQIIEAISGQHTGQEI